MEFVGHEDEEARSLPSFSSLVVHVNGKEMIGWDSPIYDSKKDQEYESSSEYLCECIGVSQPKNVCTCAMDLASFNNMTMGELFNKFEEGSVSNEK